MIPNKHDINGLGCIFLEQYLFFYTVYVGGCREDPLMVLSATKAKGAECGSVKKEKGFVLIDSFIQKSNLKFKKNTVFVAS